MKFNNASLIIATAALACSTTTGLELTTKNFEEMTAGKTVFIKFFAPWCGHCKAMGPDWEKLMTEYQDHDVALVAEVDCTSDTGDELCEKFNVEVCFFFVTVVFVVVVVTLYLQCRVYLPSFSSTHCLLRLFFVSQITLLACGLC